MWWQRTRRRGGWRGRKWGELENRNWKMENGKRVAARDWGVSFSFFRREKRRFQHRGHRGVTEFTEERTEEKSEERKCVASDRKSPPLQTKGGAPSSSVVKWRDRDQRAQAGMPVPPSHPQARTTGCGLCLVFETFGVRGKKLKELQPAWLLTKWSSPLRKKTKTEKNPSATATMDVSFRLLSSSFWL
jgi:hypothetical protein